MKPTLHMSPMFPLRTLLDSVWNAYPGLEESSPIPSSPAGWVTPVASIQESPENYTVVLELPGVSKEDIKVDFKENHLTISGEKKASSPKDTKVYSERRFGKFSRTFELGTQVDQDKVAATFKDGVLEVTAPKSASLKGRSIAIL